MILFNVILAEEQYQGSREDDLTENLDPLLLMAAFNFDENMLESTIENSSSFEDNSDIVDRSMPLPLEHALEVPYVKFSYLYHLANGFDENRVIGKGGFSEVYKAETIKSKKLIAIKKLKDSADARELMNFEGMRDKHIPSRIFLLL